MEIWNQFLAASRLLLPGLLPALGLSAGVLALGLLLRRGPAGGALAIATGYLAGHVAILGWPAWPPVEAVQRLFYCTLAVAVVSCVEGLVRRKRLWEGAFLLLALGAPAVVLLSTVRTWSWGESAVLVTGLGLACLALRKNLAGLAVSPTAVNLSMPLLAVLAGTAGVALQSGNALVGQLTLGLAFALAPVLAWAAIRPAFRLDSGTCAVIAIILPGLWLIGWFYGEMPKSSMVLLVSVLPVAWLTRQLTQRLLAPWPRWLSRVTLPLLMIPAALLLALPADNSEDEGALYRNWTPSSPVQAVGHSPVLPAAGQQVTGGDENPFERWTTSPPDQ
jgi:hypothetical protein